MSNSGLSDRVIVRGTLSKPERGVGMTGSYLERYVRQYYSSVYSAALCGCKNPSDACDIAQEIFLKLYLYSGKFNEDEHVKAWLLRCTMNKCKDILKSYWNRNSLPLESAADKMTGMSDRDDENSLIPVLMKVSRKCRIVLYLYYYEEYPVNEIAEILSISEFAVRARMKSGKKQLRKLLESGGNDYGL